MRNASGHGSGGIFLLKGGSLTGRELIQVDLFDIQEVDSDPYIIPYRKGRTSREKCRLNHNFND